MHIIKLLKTSRKLGKETITDSAKEQIYSKLISLNIDSKENRKLHVNEILNKLADDDEKISNNICPKYGGDNF